MPKLNTKHPAYQTDDDGYTKRGLEAAAAAKVDGPFDASGEPLPRCKVSGKVLEQAAELATGMHRDHGPGSLLWGQAFPQYKHPDPADEDNRRRGAR